VSVRATRIEAEEGDGTSTVKESLSAPRRRRRTATITLFIVGTLLLLAAIWTIAANRGQFEAAWNSARQASWWVVVLVFAAPIVNIGLTGLSFAILTRRRGHVGHREMIGLIWIASVLNQLPLRPGLFGRIAYHRVVNRIPVGLSVRVVLEVLACAVAANALLLTALLVAGSAGWDGSTLLWMVFALICTTLACAGVCRTAWLGCGGWRGHAWRYPAVLAVRLADMGVWGARYVLVFWLIGVPIDARGGAALACAGQAAMMAPVPMGLREWVVGATAAWLPPEFVDERRFVRGAEGVGSGMIERATPGLMADVLNRSVELAVGVPGALIAGVWLGRRVRRSTLDDSHANTHRSSDL
jgi:predicted nucleic acid-binding Zn ribbon protein